MTVQNMQGTFVPQTLDPRCAGKVTRYHTWPRVRDQSIGEHTWQVMRIVLAIWPEAPRDFLIHAMFHDVGERVTGDVPYPVKAERPDVKAAFDFMERSAVQEMEVWGVITSRELSPDERITFKLAEFIEMWEYALDEISMGNLNFTLIADRCLAQAKVIITTLPPGGTKDLASIYIRTRTDYERAHRRRNHHQF